MRRHSNSGLKVDVVNGVVSLVATGADASATFNMSPEIASDLADQLADACLVAQSQYIDHEAPTAASVENST